MAASIEKQKKGNNMYVYNFGTAGSRTPDYHPTMVTKRVVSISKVWGLRKSKNNKDIEDHGVKEKKRGESLVSSVESRMGRVENIVVDGRKSVEKELGKVGKFVVGRKSVSHLESGVALIGKGDGSVEGGRKSMPSMESEVLGKVEKNVVDGEGRKIAVENIIEGKKISFPCGERLWTCQGSCKCMHFRCARRTYDSLEKFSAKHMACNMKKEFDRVYGPAWHCIVGSSFGSFVTHSTGCFLYFSMEKLYILLFKTKVQRAVE
ncbi:hypothetical protein Ancab_035300 [Ancistrocladus abbreviatus]